MSKEFWREVSESNCGFDDLGQMIISATRII